VHNKFQASRACESESNSRAKSFSLFRAIVFHGFLNHWEINDMPLWPELVPAISVLLDKIIPDPNAREKAKTELLKSEREADLEAFRLALSADVAQAEINKIEASSSDIFVAGWRPFIGWVCGVAFAYHFIVQPLLAFGIANAGGEVKLPGFDMDALFTVLMGMLGLGGLRTIEKIRGSVK
jgi:hypothetical protein